MGAFLFEWLGQPAGYAQRILLGVKAAVALPTVDASKVALFGYCFGATGVLNVALDDVATVAAKALNIKAVFSFHAGLTLRATGKKAIDMRVAAYSGALDDAAVDITALEHELANRSAPFEITRYSGTHHAFTVFDQIDDAISIAGNNVPVGYAARADSRSFAAAVDYLRIAFGQEPIVGTPRPLPLIAIAQDPHTIGFTNVNDIVLFAQRYAAEAVFLKQPRFITSFEKKLLKACEVDVARYRNCYLDVRKAFDVARVGLGGHRTLHAGSESSLEYVGKH